MDRRSDMAAMLWQAREAAGFNGYAFAGKRIPSIEARVKKILDGPAKNKGGRSEVANVIERMNEVALRAGMPLPRRHAKRKG